MLGFLKSETGPMSYAKGIRKAQFPMIVHHDYGTEVDLKISNKTAEGSIILITDLRSLNRYFYSYPFRFASQQLYSFRWFDHEGNPCQDPLDDHLQRKHSGGVEEEHNT